MNQLHIKKNDVVVVLAGEERGKSGKVLAVDRAKRRVQVEGINIVRKAVRKSESAPQGGIITKEAPIPACKVMAQERYQARRARRAQTSAAAGGTA